MEHVLVPDIFFQTIYTIQQILLLVVISSKMSNNFTNKMSLHYVAFISFCIYNHLKIPIHSITRIFYM